MNLCSEHGISFGECGISIEPYPSGTMQGTPRVRDGGPEGCVCFFYIYRPIIVLSTFQCNVLCRISCRYIFCVFTHFLSAVPLICYSPNATIHPKQEYSPTHPDSLATHPTAAPYRTAACPDMHRMPMQMSPPPCIPTIIFSFCMGSIYKGLVNVSHVK